ncbi:putative membrane protein YesL [Deinobacterium chartae]|uniref:Putative membrane protein YesL n=1 Tax=Deinobacterium chartae TaxID=521158 RepID=A0A841I1X9_9DEIO|nr:putative membrane protein YesL [Deinobacterium chartae]
MGVEGLSLRLPRAARRPLLAPWRDAAGWTFSHLTRVIGVNLLWLLASWPLLTLGPATLAAYAWLRRARLEPEVAEPYTRLRDDFCRLFWRGLGWALASATLLYVLYANALFWPRLLPPLAGAVVAVAALYLAVLYLAVQPYLLEALVTLPRAMAAPRAAIARLVARPLAAHLHLLFALPLALLVWRFPTLLALGAVGLLLVFWHALNLEEAAEDPRLIELL